MRNEDRESLVPAVADGLGKILRWFSAGLLAFSLLSIITACMRILKYLTLNETKVDVPDWSAFLGGFSVWLYPLLLVSWVISLHLAAVKLSRSRAQYGLASVLICWIPGVEPSATTLLATARDLLEAPLSADRKRLVQRWALLSFVCFLQAAVLFVIQLLKLPLPPGVLLAWVFGDAVVGSVQRFLSTTVIGEFDRALDHRLDASIWDHDPQPSLHQSPALLPVDNLPPVAWATRPVQPIELAPSDDEPLVIDRSTEMEWHALQAPSVSVSSASPVPSASPAPSALSAPSVPAIRTQPVTPTPVLMTCVGCGRTTEERRCSACGASLVCGQFRVTGLLGQSPHARTYLAVNAEGTQVALKELAMSLVPDARAIDAFEREGRLLESLRHPKIPRFLSAFVEGSGAQLRFYLAQEYIEGRSLLTELREQGAPYSEEEGRFILAELLPVLSFLDSHQPRIIHRDIKPSNILRRPDGSLVLIDFGAAREAGHTLMDATLVGTYGYMPPEQLAGQVDSTTDLFSLGASVLHLVSGIPPWELIGEDLQLRLPKSVILTNHFSKMLSRLVSPQRRRRFRGALDVIEVLEGRQKKQYPERAFYVGVGVAGAVVFALGIWLGLDL